MIPFGSGITYLTSLWYTVLVDRKGVLVSANEPAHDSLFAPPPGSNLSIRSDSIRKSMSTGVARRWKHHSSFLGGLVVVAEEENVYNIQEQRKETTGKTLY